MPCQSIGSAIVCFAPRTDFLDEEPCEVRWCFKCHDHRMHYLHVERPRSPWFDTEYRLRCDGCGELAVDMNGNCIDLGKWNDAMRESYDAFTDERAATWPKRPFYCLGCQAEEPRPGGFGESGKCAECQAQPTEVR